MTDQERIDVLTRTAEHLLKKELWWETIELVSPGISPEDIHQIFKLASTAQVTLSWETVGRP